MTIAIGLLILSIVLLYFGAEFSLEGSEKIGYKLGMSPLAVGMLLVGFGTSLPEFFVGHIAAFRGEIGIAFGSLIGSNIANMFLVLGICGLLTPLKADDKSLVHQLFIHLALGFCLFFVLTRDELTVFTAAPLIALCGFYLFMLYRDFLNSDDLPVSDPVQNLPLVLIKMFAGFGMLYLGGELLVKSGTDICEIIGIDTYIISAIFIAFGTSFPELVTSVIACVKKKDTNLILGNIIGSNLFNCAFILGSLGIYNFKIEGDYLTEVYSLIAGASFLVILGVAKKSFRYFGSILFLGGYTYMVGYWTKLF